MCFLQDGWADVGTRKPVYRKLFFLDLLFIHSLERVPKRALAKIHRRGLMSSEWCRHGSELRIATDMLLVE